MKHLVHGLFVLSIFFASQAKSAQNQEVWGSSGAKPQGNLKQALRVAEAPKPITALFPKKAIRVFSIDLNSDSKQDYIVTMDRQTCYVDSSFKKKGCEKRFIQGGFVHYYFAQLDEDPMLELFEFLGDEDMSDYKLLKLDATSWVPRKILEFDPYLKAAATDSAHRGIYWGYPWDITDLPVKKEGSSLLIQALTAPPEKPAPGDSSSSVGILFDGVPTQGGKQGDHDEKASRFKWVSLKDLTAAAKRR